MRYCYTTVTFSHVGAAGAGIGVGCISVEPPQLRSSILLGAAIVVTWYAQRNTCKSRGSIIRAEVALFRTASLVNVNVNVYSLLPISV